MLSYQHAYHAGNAADVHKHALLAVALDYMVGKPKPLTYVETHAGRALYDLASAESLKTGEAAFGIGISEKWFPKTHPYARAIALAGRRPGARPIPGPRSWRQACSGPPTRCCWRNATRRNWRR